MTKDDLDTLNWLNDGLKQVATELDKARSITVEHLSIQPQISHFWNSVRDLSNVVGALAELVEAQHIEILRLNRRVEELESAQQPVTSR